MLSRDHHLSNEQLTYLFHSISPNQTPKNFSISPLPPTIISWLHLLMPSPIKTQALRPPRCRSKLGALTDGNDSCQALASKMNGLTDSSNGSVPNCSPHLRQAVDEIKMGRQRNLSSQDLPLRPPFQMFARPFGRIYGQTQPSIPI